jgi:uncharacterized protein YdaT
MTNKVLHNKVAWFFSVIVLSHLPPFAFGQELQSDAGAAIDFGYRAEIAQAVIDRWQGTSEATSVPRWERGFRVWLKKLSTEDLESVLQMDDYEEVTATLHNQGAQSAGAGVDQTLSAIGKRYYSLDPCRIVDTRRGAGELAGPVGAKQEKDFSAKNAAMIKAQGGHSGGCGVPATATALVVNITAVDQAGVGHLRAWPAGAPRPLASIVNFAGDTIANSTILPICTTACTADFTIFASTESHIVVDVMGYFAD